MERKNLITVLGSANFDTFLNVNRVPKEGETISATGISTSCGGKGANTAAALGKLKANVNFVGQVGKDEPGHILLENIKESGVNIEYLRIIENKPSGQAFILSFPNKDNSIIIVGGANMEWDDCSLKNIEDSLKQSKILMLQREVPDDVNLYAVKLAKELGVEVIFDVGGSDAEFKNDLIHYIDIISPNETELERILGYKVENIRDEDVIRKALGELRSKHNNEKLKLLLKLGKHGSLFIDENNNLYRQNAVDVPGMKIVDTTGAGDCFTASFCSQYIQNQSIENCLFFASVSAFLCITKRGTIPALPTLEYVESTIKSL